MPKNNYGFGDRLLHHFALNSTNILEMSFMMDQMLRRSDPEYDDSELCRQQKHIFISGLARAGTTAIMRLFYDTGVFCSLTYRDMPFPLAPFFWRKTVGFSSKRGELNERAHGDGIMVDFDSPEAIEEVFWRVFCRDQYILDDRLLPMEAEQTVIETFRKYISSLLQVNNAHRYLSKNNNNIIRLTSIKNAFPDSIIIIPYRDPLQQAYSLYNQHCRFIDRHSKDTFSQHYMRWLVHHEFGSDHRYFDVNCMPSENSPSNPAYWLDQWINVYRYILQQDLEHKLSLYFIGYEELCTNPDTVWNALAEQTSLPMDLPQSFTLSPASTRDGFAADSNSINEAYAIHAELQQRFYTTVTAS